MIGNSLVPFVKAATVFLICLMLAACVATEDEATNSDVATANSVVVQENTVNARPSDLPIPLYRLYNRFSGEHLYTQSQSEYIALGSVGWTQENIAFYAFSRSVVLDEVAARPWLRVYNPNSGMHHWTTSQNEYDTLGQLGWIQESASGYIFDRQVTGAVPLYRLYNKNNGTHHWTLDSNERGVLITFGWKDEGIAGYVFKNVNDYDPASYARTVLTLGGQPISGVGFNSGNNSGLTTQYGVFAQDGSNSVTFKVAGLTVGTVSDANLPASIEGLVASNPTTNPVIRNLPALLTELNAVGSSNPIANFRLHDLEQQLFKPSVLPRNRVLGMNLETPQAEADGIDQPLITADIFRGARPFKENSCEKVTYDDNRWPNKLISAECADADTANGESKYAFTRILQFSTSQSAPAGTYTVLYDGKGAVHFSGMGCNRRFVNGVLLIDIAATNGCPHSLDGTGSYNGGNNARGLEVSITEIDAADPIRNIRIVMPGGVCKGNPFTRVADATDCGNDPYISFVEVLKANRNAIVFNPDYLNFAKDFRVLRMMNLMEASPRRPESQTFNPCDAFPSYNECILSPLTWSMRPTMEHPSWGGSYKTPVSRRQGVPLEVGVALANLLKAHPWLNIPHNADNDYLTQYATLLANELDDSLIAHIEYSNEVWNSGFWGHHYSNIKGAQDNEIAAMANFDGRSTEYSVRTRYYAKRATEVFMAFENEFGDNSRLKRILGGQNKFPAIIGDMLSYGSTTEHTDAVAIAPYFHGCWSRASGLCADANQTISEATSVDQVFDAINNYGFDGTSGDPDSLDGTIYLLAPQKAQLDLVTSRKIELYAYEGGQHLTVKGGLDNDTAESLQDFVYRANRDPRMKESYLRLLNGWKDAGASLFVLFTAPQTYNKFGSFGIKEHLNKSRAESPKYDAVLTFQEALMGCWPGYVEDGC